MVKILYFWWPYANPFSCCFGHFFFYVKFLCLASCCGLTQENITQPSTWLFMSLCSLFLTSLSLACHAPLPQTSSPNSTNAHTHPNSTQNHYCRLEYFQSWNWRWCRHRHQEYSPFSLSQLLSFSSPSPILCFSLSSPSPIISLSLSLSLKSLFYSFSLSFSSSCPIHSAWHQQIIVYGCDNYLGSTCNSLTLP